MNSTYIIIIGILLFIGVIVTISILEIIPGPPSEPEAPIPPLESPEEWPEEPHVPTTEDLIETPTGPPGGGPPSEPEAPEIGVNENYFYAAASKSYPKFTAISAMTSPKTMDTTTHDIHCVFSIAFFFTDGSWAEIGIEDYAPNNPFNLPSTPFIYATIKDVSTGRVTRKNLGGHLSSPKNELGLSICSCLFRTKQNTFIYKNI
jgi:hypothetical protein